jgi:hypothetical protein
MVKSALLVTYFNLEEDVLHAVCVENARISFKEIKQFRHRNRVKDPNKK